MSGTTKPVNQKAWFLILPVLFCVAFSAIVPLMTVVNYSVQDIISPERRVFVGVEWFAAVMRDEELHAALCARSPSLWPFCWWKSRWASCWRCPCRRRVEVLGRAGGGGAVAADPWNVVGTIWQIYGRADIGLLGAALQKMGIDYSYTGNATHAWITVLVMDVALDAAGRIVVFCRSAQHSRRVLPRRPDRRREQAGCVPLHPAAQDAWRADDRRAAALHGQLHDLHRALRAHRRRAGQCHNVPVAVPHAKAVGQFDLGPAAAFSLIYFLIILLLISFSTTGCSAWEPPMHKGRS